jgi:hypothetical protein
MSGALMWPDEKARMPFSEIGWFRFALAYRSSLILGKPRSEFEPVWIALKRVAPNWPGFRVDRCSPATHLVDLLNKQRNKSARRLNRLDRGANKEWKPLSGSAGIEQPE